MIVDLMYEKGIAGMRDAISNTAKYGDITVGPYIIDDSVKARMQYALSRIQNGSFAKEWISEFDRLGFNLEVLNPDTSTG